MATKIKCHQKWFTEQDKDRLVNAYFSGKTTYELAKEFGCDRGTVSRNLKARGIKMRKRSATDGEVAQMAKLYKDGFSCAKISQIVGFCPSAVWGILTREGIKLRNTRGEEDCCTKNKLCI